MTKFEIPVSATKSFLNGKEEIFLLTLAQSQSWHDFPKTYPTVILSNSPGKLISKLFGNSLRREVIFPTEETAGQLLGGRVLFSDDARFFVFLGEKFRVSKLGQATFLHKRFCHLTRVDKSGGQRVHRFGAVIKMALLTMGETLGFMGGRSPELLEMQFDLAYLEKLKEIRLISKVKWKTTLFPFDP